METTKEKEEKRKRQKCKQWKDMVRNGLLWAAEKKLNIFGSMYQREDSIQIQMWKMFLSWSRWSWLCKGEMI